MMLTGIKSDFHMHTNFTDGKSSVEEMIRAANENRLEKIAITEHIRADSKWVNEYIDAVQKGRKNSGCAVVLGFETKLLDMNGTLDISKDAQNRAELIICSLHRIPGLHEMSGDMSISKLDHENPKDFQAFGNPKSQNKTKTKDIYNQALKAICKNKSVDIIGHPFDLLQKFNVPMPDAREMQDIANTIADCRKVVEINTNYNVPPVEFIRICRSCGIKFSIGSDAHDASRVGDISRAIEMLKQAGGSKDDLMKRCFI